MDEHDFGERYFEHDCGRPYRHDDFWRGFFGRIADVIVSDLRPGRVLDAGCAMGFLVEALRARGVEAYGFDLSSYALAQAPAAARALLAGERHRRNRRPLRRDRVPGGAASLAARRGRGGDREFLPTQRSERC